ncbi:hypothetical protein [Paractinoplanes rishiriensis]|uniref:Septum formation-related domain-containing protein n=1 Tax=Paractinoplanes rishiriensis TaxID=1050105 RepID=A0A919MUG1_9ACTN|nr:hypothetical protein [Actinoplanes rishiriensis]GIE95753.1 hypothetical protein Ari01nite_32180 [Actinoplanes rishiriensis]
MTDQTPPSTYPPAPPQAPPPPAYPAPLRERAEGVCAANFADRVRDPHVVSRVDTRYLFPSEGGWATDRSTICIVTDPIGRTTGSVMD